MGRGQTIHIPTRYDDPRMNPVSPSFDPHATNYGHITGRNDNPQPRQES